MDTKLDLSHMDSCFTPLICHKTLQVIFTRRWHSVTMTVNEANAVRNKAVVQRFTVEEEKKQHFQALTVTNCLWKGLHLPAEVHYSTNKAENYVWLHVLQPNDMCLLCTKRKVHSVCF